MRRLAALALLACCSGTAGAFSFGRAEREREASALSALRAAYEAGDCAAVPDRFTALLDEKPPSSIREEAYGYLGRCHEASGAADKAINDYSVALGLYPDNADFARRLGLLYVKTGFYAEAVPHFEKALAAGPEDAETRLGLGRAYAGQGFLARAKEHYSRAATLTGFRDAALLEEYARWMLRKRDWEEAAFLVAKATASASARPAPFWKTASARIWAGRGEYRRAASELEAQPGEEPGREAQLERALYLLLGGNAAESERAAGRLLSADPRDTTAALIAGMALSAQGRKAEAAARFSAAAEAGGFAGRLAAALVKQGVQR